MSFRRVLAAFVALVCVAAPAASQQKRQLEHDDYAIWNRIQNETLSRDGAWLLYRLVPGEGDASLVIRSTGSDAELVVERGASPRFTWDSRYVVAQVDPMEEAVDSAREEGLRGARAPKDSLVVVRLEDLSVVHRAERVRSFATPEEAGGWIAYLHEEALDEEGEEGGDEAETPERGRPGEGESDDEDDGPERLDDGTRLVALDLASGVERTFEHVLEYAFMEDGSALFYAASGEEGEADGVYRVGATGDAMAVASGEGRYTDLAVSAGSGRVAFVTDRDDRASEAPAFALYVAEGDGMAASRVAVGHPALPADWAPSQNGDVSFSESGARIFFGTAPRPEPEPEDDTPEDERVVVDVWNWQDPYLQPMQLVQAERERDRTYEAVLDENGGVVQLATPDVPSVDVADEGDGDVAIGISDLPYRQLVSWDGRYADIYVVNVADGSREKAVEMVRGFASLSPTGRWITWWDGVEKAWFALDTDTKTVRNVTADVPSSFFDAHDDRPEPPGSYGSAGWTEGDERMVLYDRTDIWMVDPTGEAAALNATEGRGRDSNIRFRVIDLDRDDPFVPTERGVMLHAFDLETKASGYWREDFGSNAPPVRVFMEDAAYSQLRMADDADLALFERSTFEEFPDLWVTSLGFDDRRRLTDANPQQSEYLWGTAELVDWTSVDGDPLQGILYKPEGFDPSRKYPMMVYFYERNSDGLHSYTVPAAGSSSINRSFYVSRGYLLFVPDIPYRLGYPGESAVDAVVPGVLSLIAEGFVDADRIGVQGHSWGGYQIAYMVTRTDIFAAAEAGAPVSNMTSAYGGIRWQSGMSRMFQYEKTQSRIGGTLWETPLRYIENSPIFTADKIRTPVLMMHNDEDGAVPWYQGIEFFVALRRLGKPAFMLNYNGEAHGLRQEHNQRDWAIRMQQFFDHYLRDEPPPVWMADGVPAVLKGKTLGLELKATRPISQEEEGGRR